MEIVYAYSYIVYDCSGTGFYGISLRGWRNRLPTVKLKRCETIEQAKRGNYLSYKIYCNQCGKNPVEYEDFCGGIQIKYVPAEKDIFSHINCKDNVIWF
jgi:hypothetical protein